MYVYRMEKYLASAVSFPVFVGDTEVSKLGNGSYFVVPVDPGKHVIGTKMVTYDDEPIEVDVAAGESIFLRLEAISIPLGLAVRVELAEVNPEVAQLEMRACARETDRYSGPAI